MNISHCRECGAYLRLRLDKVIGYTASGGKKIRNAYLECPNKKRKWIFDNHDHWEGHVYEGDSEFHFDTSVIDF